MFENMYSFCQIKFLNNNNNAVSAVSISFAVTQLTQEDTMSFLCDISISYIMGFCLSIYYKVLPLVLPEHNGRVCGSEASPTI